MAFEKNLNDARERAKKVKLFGHDIHGVLTANIIFCDIEGNKRYGFWHMDGFADLPSRRTISRSPIWIPAP
jgi:3-deoxy-D-manno-octulosonate 8-phosphate phosphatase (KDO 8-P phosphatase)